MPYGNNSTTGLPGPAPKPAESGNKKQARQRINVEVRSGRRPHPSTLPCTDCEHIGDDKRHEYDHHLGYDAEHHLDVEPVCTTCHAARDSKRVSQTHCKHGHEFNDLNTYIAKNGTRHCKTCAKLRVRKPRGKEYWAKVNAKRKDKNYGK